MSHKHSWHFASNCLSLWCHGPDQHVWQKWLLCDEPAFSCSSLAKRNQHGCIPRSSNFKQKVLFYSIHIDRTTSGSSCKWKYLCIFCIFGLTCVFAVSCLLAYVHQVLGLLEFIIHPKGSRLNSTWWTNFPNGHMKYFAILMQKKPEIKRKHVNYLA